MGVKIIAAAATLFLSSIVSAQSEGQILKNIPYISVLPIIINWLILHSTAMIIRPPICFRLKMLITKNLSSWISILKRQLPIITKQQLLKISKTEKLIISFGPVWIFMNQKGLTDLLKS